MIYLSTYMMCTKKDATEIRQIVTGGQVFRKVENFKYLGVIINEEHRRCGVMHTGGKKSVLQISLV